jgi:hypothetical protein
MENNNPGAENAAASGKKIDRKTAEEEFNRFCENNEIENIESSMEEEEKTTFNDIKERFIKVCCEGRAEVDGTSLKYTISKFSKEGFKGEVVTIQRPGGAAYSAMDSTKDRENVKRLNCFLSAITGKEVSYFTKIDGKDWKFFNAVAQLFLSL